MTVAAITQPTHLPWAGWFDIMDQADVVVLLDTVQLTPRSWQTRNRVKTANGVAWLSVPVRQRRGQAIAQALIQNETDWGRKHLDTLRQAYARAPHWPDLADELAAVYGRRWDHLRDLNEALIRIVAGRLKIDAAGRLVRASDLAATGRRTDLLVSICREVGADVYLSTPGARAYLPDDAPFARAGLELRWHEYAHPVYPQPHGDFVSHMAAIDLLANVGPAAPEVMRSGRRDPVSA